MTEKWVNGRLYRLDKAGRYRMVDAPYSLLARALWEAAHGPLQKGDVVHHKNENPAYDDLANLEKLSRADHTRHHKHLQNFAHLPMRSKDPAQGGAVVRLPQLARTAEGGLCRTGEGEGAYPRMASLVPAAVSRRRERTQPPRNHTPQG